MLKHASPLKKNQRPITFSPHSYANNFDFLRFLGASLVIYGHTYPLSGRGNLDYLQALSQGLFPTAHMGVCLFFVISGYLIAQSLENSPSMANFIWKRSIRIFPGLFVAVFFTVFLLGPLVTNLSFSEYLSTSATYKYFLILKLYPYYPDGLPGVFESDDPMVNGSLWTLAYEFTCYLSLLIAFKVFRSYRKKIVLLLFVLFWSTFFFWYEPLSSTTGRLPLLNLRVFNLIDFGMYFVAGAVAFYFKDYIAYRGTLAVSMLGFWLGAYFLSQHTSFFPLSGIIWARYLALPYLVLYFTFQVSPLNFFGRFGDYSYGLYIYAFPVQRLVILWLGATTNVSQLVVMSFVCTLPLAWLSWNYIEKPCLRYKHILK
ncbi:peptidoglycan/LPS O-acetylase OafA/YrhL [Rhabdobacter roseus]|uniref:Peptidoglycan/LPS O-acetylase OafA/YrhL n=1 Tax=Rhabdobacter roseus TaxID=1655419 RepID=A0A840TQM3_9BACT|nr:acyltransferase [Rhabdobacter roseus]MBB5282049.1 peptidoglycan/LPS O-acetylase OafA/YrhL [Rhabdobacter roseus]